MAVLIACGVVTGMGCQRALFQSSESRTQFETYDLMRQKYIEPVEPDVFGNPQPALRQRLSRR